MVSVSVTVTARKYRPIRVSVSVSTYTKIVVSVVHYYQNFTTQPFNITNFRISIQKAFHPIVFCCTIVVKFGLMHSYVGWRFGPIKNQNIMRQANAGIMQMLLGHKSCKPAVIEITVQRLRNCDYIPRFCQEKTYFEICAPIKLKLLNDATKPRQNHLLVDIKVVDFSSKIKSI